VLSTVKKLAGAMFGPLGAIAGSAASAGLDKLGYG